MADCHDIFLAFDNCLRLNKSRCDKLRKSRRALRKVVRAYFRENDLKPAPLFWGQGSFSTGTAINPQKGGYDLDDGIYLQVDEEWNMTPKTVHGWIIDAVSGHTSLSPTDKYTCVRVNFADENNPHHIDLPVYILKEGEGHPLLAHLKHGWVGSDPREFQEWFEDKCDKDGQLKRLVRYAKTWREAKGIIFPKSFVLTALLATYFQPNSRDDKALRDTLERIHEALSANFSFERPTTPVGEELLAEMDSKRQECFLMALKEFIDDAGLALEQTAETIACTYWKKHFGKRFPVEMAEDEVDEAKRWASPPTIRSDARSASSA